ncbi:hypothetical protein TrCOL_g1117 [Triparma columacea]|uniref:Uncharacterized protein n=1 Tax=Triparma columacea TaxID=722753 RepID=A0A9W7G479_9STRA|nr:hypothetical protein TrCOL_g1117 [Triparma columacea]
MYRMAITRALILSISLSFSTYYYYSPLDVSPLEDDADQNTRMGGLLSIFGIIVSVLGFFGDYLAVGSCEKKITADPDAVVKFPLFLSTLSSFVYLSSAIFYFISISASSSSSTSPSSAIFNFSICTMVASAVNVLLLLLTRLLFPPPPAPPSSSLHTSPPSFVKRKKDLAILDILVLLKPYFWPDATSTSAVTNRVRACMTWVFVALSKVCSIYAPLLIGRASTCLIDEDYYGAITNSIIYVALTLLSKTFKEGQSLVYLRVAQAAFVQLSKQTFNHLHDLSLDWHLRKKLGDVLRSMDRGISACDTLMKYGFLYLIPALTECVVVCLIFALHFKYWPLAVTIFYFIFLYVLVTILMTLWRKKFRKSLNKNDNDYHDKITDSLVNFETVKYFTAERWEEKRFGDAVSKFQAKSVSVQASLSALNISQQLLMQACLGLALTLSVFSIRDRIECEDSEDEGSGECYGMEPGDFVSVTIYILQLFAPLNFLGTVYNALVMAFVDLGNLSELLAEETDIMDVPGAVDIPRTKAFGGEDVIKFEDVRFRYPTAPIDKGLKGLNLTLKKGTVTAIVGPTGAGKTTISRLLLRFYDVGGGRVVVNGVDIKKAKQESLRQIIGVVPQDTPLFNDTIRYNIAYGNRDASQSELEKAAREANILDFIESQTKGWETMVGERGLKLSGGEKQRVAIARCLLKNPDICVLDEATSALDTVTENSVQEALNGLASSARTTLVIAHRLGTIRNAHQICVIGDGKVEELGTHDELMEMKGMYAELWNMQLKNVHGQGDANPTK